MNICRQARHVATGLGHKKNLPAFFLEKRPDMKLGKISVLAVIWLSAFILVGVKGSGLCEEKNPYQKDPESCASCHVIKPYVQSWKSSDFLDHKHSKAGIGCLECHQLTDKQEKENVTKFRSESYKTSLSQREYPNDFCLRCHGSYKEVAERTKNYQKKDLTQNPHESHNGEINCNLCHKSHKPSVDSCSECHPPVVQKPGWTQKPRWTGKQ